MPVANRRESPSPARPPSPSRLAANVGRTFAKEHLAREHDHASPSLAGLVPACPARTLKPIDGSKRARRCPRSDARSSGRDDAATRASRPGSPCSRITGSRPANPASLLDDGVVDVAPEQLDSAARVREGVVSARSTLDDVLDSVRDGRALAAQRARSSRSTTATATTTTSRCRSCMRHGVRAVFFIATDFVERRRLFWWDRIARILKSVPSRASRRRIPRAPRVVRSTARPRGSRPSGARSRVVKDRRGLDLAAVSRRALTRAAGVALAAPTKSGAWPTRRS